jgi:hypothetical protein
LPAKITFYEPDAIDCNTLVSAIGNDFGCIPTLETRYERDMVVVICKCRKLGGPADDMVQVQSLVTCPLRAAKSLYIKHYAALLDCWHQLDRGVLAAAARPIERGWNGRPQAPAKTGNKNHAK